MLPSQPPLRLEPAPSRWTMGYLLLVHALAAGAIMALDGSLALRGAMLLLVLVSLMENWQRGVRLQGKGVVRSAEWDAAGLWTLQVGGMGRVKGELSGSTLVHPRLVILNFRTGRWRRYSLVLPTDALAPDLLRRLRVRLRITQLKPE